MRLLVTRPNPDANAFAASLQRRGHEVIVSPVLEVRFKPANQILPKEKSSRRRRKKTTTDVAPGSECPRDVKGGLDWESFSGMILTSRNSVRALPAILAYASAASFGHATQLPVFCVGASTASEAIHNGFNNVYIGEAGANELAPMIARTVTPDDGILFYPAGVEVAGNLAAILATQGYQICHPVVYGTFAADRLSDPALEALGADQLDGVLLMSPRSAQIFYELVNKAGLASHLTGVKAFCLSEKIAAALPADSGLVPVIAKTPDATALMEALA